MMIDAMVNYISGRLMSIMCIWNAIILTHNTVHFIHHTRCCNSIDYLL